MNLDYKEALQYIAIMSDITREDIDLILAPTSIYLGEFKKTNQYLAVQNVYSKDQGSFTGEISPSQLKSFGIDYAIIGHSERRDIFFENDLFINAKLKAVIRNEITPILCVGESKEEKDQAGIVITNQLMQNLRDISSIDNVIIAYEPVWSIGTGIVPTEHEIESRIHLIKELIYKKYNTNVKVLYGGSVNKENIHRIINIKNVDGVLVGSASKDPRYFLEMLDNIK